ncbi:SH3 domain-containing protein [Sphingomonas sp. RS6]
MRGWTWGIAAVASLAIAAPAVAQKKVPYFMSIKASKARMRTGPGRNYPASWLYQRAGLPVRVIGTYGEWRKIEDPDGAQGWMQVNLLDDDRFAIVRGGIAEMRASPDASAHVNWRAAPGVVGRISHCSDGWCWFDVKGRAGYVEQSKIWGADPEIPLD